MQRKISGWLTSSLNHGDSSKCHVVMNDSKPPRYTVLAPATVRPNSEYAVVVIVEACEVDTAVRLKLAWSGNECLQEVLVPPNSSRTARLQVGELGGDKVTLSADGRSGRARWHDSTTVRVHAKSASLLIQTDKAQYKPGQEVRVRVLALDARLRPTVREPLQVHVTDGAGNRIKQWVEQPAPHGLWSAVLQLSEQPVLGDWTVTASLPSLPGVPAVSKRFAVAEYVLPTFEVSVSVPSKIAFAQGKVAVTVCAKYTYGKAVVGKATVKATRSTAEGMGGGFFRHDGYPTHAVEKVVPIDETATVEFDFENDLEIFGYLGTQVVFEASVEEGLTGRKQNASGTNHTTRISRSDFEIKFVDTPFEFTPGQPFLAKVAVTDLLGAPVQDDKHAVILQIWPDHEWKTPKVLEKKMLSNGIVTLELKPEIDWYFLKVQAIYKEHTCSQTSKRAIALCDTADAQLVTKITNKCPQLGDDIELQVKSKALRKVTVLVVGPLGVEEVQTVQTLPGQEGWREAVVRFKATEYMAPASRVLVHGVGDGGELFLDAAALELAGRFTPPVEVRVDPGRSEPGRDVAVQVAAAPNARVALLAVDQSALLLAGEDARNGISHDDLRAERLTFNTSGSACGFRKSLWPKSTLRMAGMACLTNTSSVEEYSEDARKRFRSRRAPATRGMYRGGGSDDESSIERDRSRGGDDDDECIGACPEPRLRSVFPETWLWQEIDAGANGRAVLQAAVPDTITSWVVSALAVDPVHGLGLSDTSKLTVFRPFFASLSLPYSVIRGETVEVPVLVFNYLAEATTATVTMSNDRGEFDFVEGGRSATRTVAVAAQGSASVCFHITATKVGSVLLRVTARSDSAGDALELPLRVKAEGETQYRNRAIPIDLSKRKAFNAVVRIDMPGAVPDSENIQVSAIGDILGPSTANLDSLIRRPYGCGEQNMLNFVPNIVITTYLKRTGRSNPLVEAKARSFSEIGYQKELTYRHDDGSFSAFGEHDESGSTWLTAFVAMSFALARASALVQVDPRVVQQALAWLAKQQAKDGSFPEVGSVFQRDMQGGAAKGLALTAYVLTAFLQDKDLAGKHKDTVGKAVQYLLDNLECLDEPYAIAVTTHALHVADHPAKDKAFAMLEARAVTKAGLRFWSKPREKDLEPNSLDVEMTAYALMTYVSRRLLGEAMPIMQWLIHQRNSNGGFPSTQDTVVGLRALASMAELISFPLGDMTVRFKHRGRGEATMAVNSKTSMVLQKEELPRDVREVEVDAEGAGFALAQVSWSFNENTPTEYPLFHLKVTVGETTRPHLLALSITSSFIGGSWGTESNMTVVEVTLPSGFTTDQDTMAALRDNEDVRRAETKDKDTVVVLYFDKMDSKREYCVDVSAVRTHLVTQLKPVPITVYDYYDQSRQARVFYDLSRPV